MPADPPDRPQWLPWPGWVCAVLLLGVMPAALLWLRIPSSGGKLAGYVRHHRWGSYELAALGYAGPPPIIQRPITLYGNPTTAPDWTPYAVVERQWGPFAYRRVDLPEWPDRWPAPDPGVAPPPRVRRNEFFGVRPWVPLTILGVAWAIVATRAIRRRWQARGRRARGFEVVLPPAAADGAATRSDASR